MMLCIFLNNNNDMFLIQYTTNGKKVEVAIKKILAGDQVNERGALMNPDSLNLYCNIPQLSTVTNGTC